MLAALDVETVLDGVAATASAHSSTVVIAAQQHVTRVIKALSASCFSRVTAFVPESNKEDTCCGQEWPDSGMSTIRRVSGEN